MDKQITIEEFTYEIQPDGKIIGLIVETQSSYSFVIKSEEDACSLLNGVISEA